MSIKLSADTIVKIVITIILTIVMIVVFQVDFPDSFEKSSNIMTIFALGIYSWIICSSPARINGKINLYRVFVFLTIPFYFGGQILILLGYSKRLGLERYSIIDGRISTMISVDAMQYILIALLCMHIGYLINQPNKEVSYKSSHIESNERLIKGIDFVSTVLLIVTFVPTIARLIYDVISARTFGHLAAFNMRNEESYLGIWFLFTYIQGWFLPACYMKLIAGKNRKIVYALLAIYCVLYLLSGSRFQILLIIFTVFMIETYWNERRIQGRKLLKYGLLLWLLVVVLRSVSYTRDLTGSGLSLQSVFNVLGGDVIYETLYETSTTFTSVANTIKYCPSYISYNYGKSILGSIIYVLPAFLRPSIINDIVLHISAELSPLYYGFTGAGYGSAFVTEAYFNFGYYAYVVLIVFGGLVGALIKRIIHCAGKKDAFNFIVSMYIMSELAWGIRADLYLVPRHVVYYVIIPLVIARVFSNHTKKEERTE